MKLEATTGIPSSAQILRLQRTTSANLAGHGGAGEGPGSKEILAELNDEDRTLHSYGVRDYMTIRVSRLRFLCGAGGAGLMRWE